jgi:predicted nucleic acid-binding protein
MPERTTIADTTPLLYLHRIGLLSLLPRLYNRVHTPPAVVAELERGRQQGCDVPAVSSLRWLKVTPLPAETVWPNIPDLGEGEAEVLALAKHSPGCLVLMDDTLGRQLARLNQITVTGTAGVLLRAKREGRLPSLRTALQQLTTAGFWLDDETAQHLLRLAQER